MAIEDLKIPRHEIRDLRSFNEVTGGGRQIAGLYSFVLLDCLFDLAHKVSLDFFRRPRQYIRVHGDAVPAALAQLRSRYGCHEEFLSKSQREEIYAPLFGLSYSPDPIVSTNSLTTSEYSFSTLSHQLYEAANTFASSVMPQGEVMLRAFIESTHIVFKEWLKKRQGASVTWSKDGSLQKLAENTAYPILRDRGVAAVFGITEPPSNDWPWTYDANGSKLVEEISTQLMKDEPEKIITEGQFDGFQLTGLLGAEAIATIIDFHDHNDKQAQDVLITKVNTWGNYLRGLQGGSIARWQLPTLSGDSRVGVAAPTM